MIKFNCCNSTIENFNQTRNKTIDYIKAFAIILVVIGHSIQYGSGVYVKENMFDDNLLIYFIYSFHMPIFMLVSGYLFFFSISKYKSKVLIINKTKTLLIPVALWTILTTFLDCLLYDKERLMNPFRFAVAWANQFIGRFWFLWAVFTCSLVVIIVKRIFKDSIIAYFAILIITLFTPDIMLSPLIKFMYPFFVIGYFANKFSFEKILKSKLGIVVLFISSVIFIVLLSLCKGEYFIYMSGYTLIGRKDILEMCYINLYRLLIGLAGSYIFVFLLAKLNKLFSGITDRVIIIIGKNTMGIYIISFFVSTYLLPIITAKLSGVNYIITLMETILTILVCILIISLTKKNKWTNRLLLGNWK